MKKNCLTNAEIEARLNGAGVSPTAQRIAICRYVLCEADHPTADHVKQWVDKNFPKMSMATVYNTLGILVKAKLLKEIRLPHIDSTVYDDNTDKHFHFVDRESGEIMDIDPAKVKLSADLEKQFNISHVEVILHGKRRR